MRDKEKHENKRNREREERVIGYKRKDLGKRKDTKE